MRPMNFSLYSPRSLSDPAGFWNGIQQHSVRTHVASANNKEALIAINPKEYRYLHSVIIAGVDLEENGFYIKKATDKYINGNNDAFSNPILLEGAWRTFVGKPLYIEHAQKKGEEKGFIADAGLRWNGETHVVDLLCAVDKKHKALLKDLDIGKYKAMSMGCTTVTQCTKCGNISKTVGDECSCVAYEKGGCFVDPEGTTRKIAELCGIPGKKDSLIFIESSFVEDPAFIGALIQKVLTNNLTEEQRKTIESAVLRVDFRNGGGIAKAASRSGLSRKAIREILYEEASALAGYHPHAAAKLFRLAAQLN